MCFLSILYLYICTTQKEFYIFNNLEYGKIGFLEIRTRETLNSQNVVVNLLRIGDGGLLILNNMDGAKYHFNHSTTFLNILRKWSKVCIAYDFEKNEGQAAFNGAVSPLIKNPETEPSYNGTFDAGILTQAQPSSDMIIIIGRYSFDKNPFIGYFANVNVWDSQMNAEELRDRTLCGNVNRDQGSLVNQFSNWRLTGSLVKKKSFDVEEIKCLAGNKINNAFLPIPELTKHDALDLCKKFGDVSYIAGNFETKFNFDVYYEALYANKKYLDNCGFYDNGRIKTWLPYRQSNDSSKLVHDITKKTLMLDSKDKFYLDWYGGPKNQHNKNICTSAYFGLVPKYQNIGEDGCEKKKCTACELENSFEHTSTLKLNGLCKYSFFDHIFTVNYDPENSITYIGNEKTVIMYDFIKKLWIMNDTSNEFVYAESVAPFRSLAIGKFVWNITNDTECGEEAYSKALTLTSCYDDQFTCNDGLCINLDQR